MSIWGDRQLHYLSLFFLNTPLSHCIFYKIFNDFLPNEASSLFPIICQICGFSEIFLILNGNSSKEPLLLSQNQLALKLEAVKISWHIDINPEIVHSLDTFPHIMSLNLVLKGERYALLQNFKSHETVLLLPLLEWLKNPVHRQGYPSAVSKLLEVGVREKWSGLFFLGFIVMQIICSLCWRYQSWAQIVQHFSGQIQRWLSQWAFNFFSNPPYCLNLCFPLETPSALQVEI